MLPTGPGLRLIAKAGQAVSSSNASGARAKFQSRTRCQSLRCSSATASSLRVIWNGVRSQPFVVFTSISRSLPAVSKLRMS